LPNTRSDATSFSTRMKRGYLQEARAASLQVTFEGSGGGARSFVLLTRLGTISYNKGMYNPF